MSGKVYLIGAGPGDPELITLKGLRLLRQADVILYDRLIPHQLLSEAKANAELIDVGKVSQRAEQRYTQTEINNLLVAKAQAGHTVARLKGGDPFVFGRGGEEAIACQVAGIPCEVIPGISSAIAVPASAGVPVTHRQVVSAFTVFAGHEDPSKVESDLDFVALAAIAKMGTLVLLMGLLQLPALVQKLVEAGLSPETPALCIENGTTPAQRQVMGTLANLPQLVAEAGFQPPAITVIGQVVPLQAQIRPTLPV
jgi:uroporphyrin-III C-methyltransferase